MHDTAMTETERFVETYLGKTRVRVAELGSKDVNGSIRPAFKNADYVGFDVEAGKGVDVVMSDGYTINSPSESFDVAVAVNCMEHVRKPWVLVRELARILKPGGLMFLVIPTRWGYHAYPIDCWRCYAEGMRGLLEEAGMEVLEASHDNGTDTFGIGCKPT